MLNHSATSKGFAGAIFIALAIAVAVGLVGYGGFMYLSESAQTEDARQLSIERQATSDSGDAVQPLGETGGQIIVAEDASITGRSLYKINGTNADVNWYLYEKDGTPVVGETRVNGITSVSTTAPLSFDGNIYAGNDNGVGTDRGEEVYFKKIPYSWNGKSVVNIPDITHYPEGIATFTFFENNDQEATANVTLGSGGSTTSLRVKIEASDNEAIGSPDFNGKEKGPLMVCGNHTTAGLMERIRPTTAYRGDSIPVPELVNGRQVLECWELKTDAIVDQGKYEFDLELKAQTGQNPANTDDVWLMFFDRCYSFNDDGQFRDDYYDQSSEGTDNDCGIDSTQSALVLNINLS